MLDNKHDQRTEHEEDRLRQNRPDDIDDGPEASFDDAPELRTTPNRPIRAEQLA